jgi:phosphopantothenoylcysteine decarboxylase/phosphopantothenate--cysteine ligase
MLEPIEILAAIRRALTQADLDGMKVLVSAGPTWEPVDPVRFLGNRSSGKMGYAVARAAALRGAKVTLVSGPVGLDAPPGVERITVETAHELRDAVLSRWEAQDAVVMAAAVADYRPAVPQQKKIGKRTAGESLKIDLLANPDILAEMGSKRRGKKPVLVGFAAETAESDGAALVSAAKEKLRAKKCDLVVANDVTEKGAGFSVDTNRVVLVSADGAEPVVVGPASKDEVAHALLDRVRSLADGHAR